MAYTSVIPVRRLDRTVDYVQNKEKTTPKSLEEAVDYAANRDKTESACFETGLGCTTASAFEDMRLNTLRWHKETGVQGYHLVQSFAEGEVTPKLAHQIGVEFAEQLLLGKYQAIVTTHLNTKHYHNHIVWSAVSLEDGKKYHSNSKSYYTEVRALSDALCQKHGLSIIETPESLRGKRQYEKWRAEENNQPTWRTAIRQDVDEAIQQSLTWRQFLSAMERKGYVSELLGKETISTTSYNQSKGRSGSYSINHQQSGRDLMTPDEVRLLDNGKCILFIRGERPVVDFKYNLLKHPNIRYAEDGGAAPYDYTAADNALDDLPGAPENYELLDMDDFLPAEAAEMKPTIQRIRRPK